MVIEKIWFSCASVIALNCKQSVIISPGLLADIWVVACLVRGGDCHTIPIPDNSSYSGHILVTQFVGVLLPQTALMNH